MTSDSYHKLPKEETDIALGQFPHKQSLLRKIKAFKTTGFIEFCIHRLALYFNPIALLKGLRAIEKGLYI